jgi:hypothetical protein
MFFNRLRVQDASPQFTAIRAVLSTINSGSLIGGVPHLIVAKRPLVTGLFAKAAS